MNNSRTRGFLLSEHFFSFLSLVVFEYALSIFNVC